MIKSIILITSIFVGASALAALNDCPKDLAGTWFCHEEGMPGDSSDETTYMQTFSLVQDSHGSFAGYNAIYDYNGPRPYEIRPDEKSRTTIHAEDKFNSQNYEVDETYLCRSGKLVKDVTSRYYKNKTDLKDHNVDSSASSEQEYALVDKNHYRLSMPRQSNGFASRSVDICERR